MKVTKKVFVFEHKPIFRKFTLGYLRWTPKRGVEIKGANSNEWISFSNATDIIEEEDWQDSRKHIKEVLNVSAKAWRERDRKRALSI